MDKKEAKKKRLKRKIRLNIILIIISSLLCLVSTYAWFVGLSQVKVSMFDLSVQMADGMSISLDGVEFGNTIFINSNNYDSVGYSKANTWGLLSPVSTVGEIYTNGTMAFYKDKTINDDSIRPKTAGGYKVFSDRIDNRTLKNGETKVYSESDFYVTFDMFVKNTGGSDYSETVDIDSEEDIYLTTDSSVSVSNSGGVLGTGLENSVRVGFLELGRVDGSLETVSAIMDDFDCTGDKNTTIDDKQVKISKICRTPSIWEPNDNSHDSGAVTWFNEHCKIRTGSDTRLRDSYSNTPCDPISDNNYYTTYAINSEIDVEEGYGVDVYDGHNGYTDTIGTGNHQHLTPMTTFRSSFTGGLEDISLMKLAPNSITKIRVYIWLEGQDIDNYDFASTGKAVTVILGLSKDINATLED